MIGSELEVPTRIDKPMLLGKTDPEGLRKLLDEFMAGDLDEQRETFEFLRQALDENRPVGFKLFS